MDSDVVIIGAGVIGLAIANELSSQGNSVVLLEKEDRYGTGISSRNTETIHAGIYYQTGSLKATLCLDGKKLLYEHCKKHKVKFNRTGKIFVAVTDKEIPRLKQTIKQAEANGLTDLKMLDQQEMKKLEPEVSAVAGVLSPSSGIVDSHGLMKSLFNLGQASGVIFAASSPVLGAKPIKDGWQVKVGGPEPTEISSRLVINAAGLYATALSQNIFPDRAVPKFFPTKGSYVWLSGKSPVKHLIYPSIMPGMVEPRVDAAPDLNGELRFGPNVEETKNLEDFDLDPQLVEKMVAGIKRYLPNIDISRLNPDCAGIRPKLYGPGDPVQDFQFDWAKEPGWLDLWGMESPGLTASLAIAKHVAKMIKERGTL